jgi:hypothetical protein
MAHDPYCPAVTSAFVVYHIDTETPILVVKNGNINDINLHKVGHERAPPEHHGDHTKHACLPIHPEEYNAMGSKGSLYLYDVHLKKHIPEHKADPVAYNIKYGHPPQNG